MCSGYKDRSLSRIRQSQLLYFRLRLLLCNAGSVLIVLFLLLIGTTVEKPICSIWQRLDLFSSWQLNNNKIPAHDVSSIANIIKYFFRHILTLFILKFL
jgi:hypothetical protein